MGDCVACGFADVLRTSLAPLDSSRVLLVKHGDLLAVHHQELFASILGGCDGASSETSKRISSAFKGLVDTIILQLVDHVFKILRLA